MLQAQIARSVGVSESTVSRVLARANLSKRSDLGPTEPVRRYGHDAPGDLLHIDTKKLGRIVRPGHRVAGNRGDGVTGAGWETLFVAIDDHARIAFTAMHPDEKTAAGGAVLERRGGLLRQAGCEHQTAAERQRFGVPVTRLRLCLPSARNQAPVHTG